MTVQRHSTSSHVSALPLSWPPPSALPSPPPPPPQEITNLPQPGSAGLADPIPLSLRKSIAVYEAGKALVAYITPEYDEIARVSICPYNMVTGMCAVGPGRGLSGGFRGEFGKLGGLPGRFRV